MIKKKRISQPDLDDWLDYIKNPKDIYDKEPKEESNEKRRRYKFDLHGFTLDEANLKVIQIIEHCVKNNYQELLLITGKGLHSKSEDIYLSKNSGKLRYSIPNYLSENVKIKEFISSITVAEKKDGGEGALIIKIKSL